MRTAIEHGAGRAPSALPKLRYFGDYELLEEVARGGMGVVYRARQVSLDRIVAVKMMRPGVLATEDEIRRFQAEARTAAGMQHPNIVAIHEVGEFDGLHYFSMDFVEGPSLAELVRQKPLAPGEAARYVQVLAEAVHYAHGKGILHRDLKPSNVLVDPNGGPRITDFGLARPMEGGAGMTVTGTLMGTPAYMPPEQAAGEGATLTAAADVYSLGAILYELLTGRPPFRGANPLATVRLVLEEEPASLRSLDATISRDLEAVCMRCLAKDPLRRYQSAAGLGADLERFLRGEPVLEPSAPLRIRPWRVAMAVVLMVAGIVWAMTRNRPLPPSHGLPGVASSQHAPPQPEGISVDPEQGSGARQVFTFRYSEPSGVTANTGVEAEFRDATGLRACRIFVELESERVQLQFHPEAGPGLRVGGDAGNFAALENAVCAIDLAGVAVGRGENSLELRIPVSFKPGFGGPKEVRSWPIDLRTDGRLPSRIRGTWTVL
jgi:serine/threonine protein kinase